MQSSRFLPSYEFNSIFFPKSKFIKWLWNQFTNDNWMDYGEAIFYTRLKREWLRIKWIIYSPIRLWQTDWQIKLFKKCFQRNYLCQVVTGSGLTSFDLIWFDLICHLFSNFVLSRVTPYISSFRLARFSFTSCVNFVWLPGKTFLSLSLFFLWLLGF